MRLTQELILMLYLQNTNESLKENQAMSFYSFLSDNYELSRFVLPKKKPLNDGLSIMERDKLKELMREKDFYEINTIIKSRYKTA